MVSRGFPVLFATDVEASAQFWELLGFERHFQLPEDGEPGYVGLRCGATEVAVTSSGWAEDQYGLPFAAGARVEMYLYVDDLEGAVATLRASAVRLLREPQLMPWGETIATVSDVDGNPVTLCATSVG